MSKYSKNEQIVLHAVNQQPNFSEVKELMRSTNLSRSEVKKALKKLKKKGAIKKKKRKTKNGKKKTYYYSSQLQKVLHNKSEHLDENLEVNTSANKNSAEG